MTLNERIEALEKLNEALNTDSDAYKKVRKNAYLNNKWFIENNIDMAINAIKSEFLEKSKIENWLSAYDIPDNPKSKKTGIIMAGNIPLVGFHDLMSVFISGNIALVKLSSKDTLLMEYVIGLLYKINPQIENYIKIEERLNDIDAIIATGSNNSFRYFEYYFGKHPHIIRKNRNGVA
ncbi:MAG TPA: acyl-CoA reductase, partial [Bacteroidetes bacterium]|nr:acyl-CoA reductase [Bacteroidota bacterium]